MVHRLIGGIAAVLLLASCGESTIPQGPPDQGPSVAASFPVTIEGAEAAA